MQSGEMDGLGLLMKIPISQPGSSGRDQPGSSGRDQPGFLVPRAGKQERISPLPSAPAREHSG